MTGSAKVTPFRLAMLLLAAPWFAAWFLWRGVAALLGLPRIVARVRMHVAPELRCPVGHRNSTHGRWECRCGFQYVGHIAAPCPSCGTVAGWFACQRCGLGMQLAG